MPNQTRRTGPATKSTKRATRKNALGGELKARANSKPKPKPKASQGKTITKSSKTETKKETTTKKTNSKTTGKLSLLEAAVQILTNASEPMTCKAIVDQAGEQKLWSSPNGKTPHNTLYAAILREIKLKGDEARFTKVERGHFSITTTGK